MNIHFPTLMTLKPQTPNPKPQTLNPKVFGCSFSQEVGYKLSREPKDLDALRIVKAAKSKAMLLP